MVTKHPPGRAHRDRQNPPTCQLSTDNFRYIECANVMPSPPCTEILKAGIDIQYLMDVEVPSEHIKEDPYDDHLIPMFPPPGHDTCQGYQSASVHYD